MFDAAPQGWREEPLRELASRISRGSAPSYAAERTSVWSVSQKCVRDGSFDLEQCRPHDEAKPVQEAAFLRAGDICVNSTGTGTLGRVALWRGRDGRYFADTHVTVVRPDPRKAVPAFLAAFLGMPSTCDTIYRECVTGSTNQIELSKAALGELVCPVPPLDEQRRIAEVLKAVDSAIGWARAVAEAAHRTSQTMRHELLRVSVQGEITDLPVGWGMRPLEELASVERGKFSIRPRNDPRYFGGSTPFIQTGDITSAGDYLTNHTQTLNEIGVAVSRVFPPGTIMTTIAANIGDFTITTYPVACPDSVVGIQAADGVHPFWLYSVLSCFKVALDRASTQNAQKNINLQTLRPLIIPVPPPSVMGELAATLEAAAKIAREAQKVSRTWQIVKKAIADDLLSGRVRVPLIIANVEPAPRPVQPAFKRAVLAAEIVHQLHKDTKFGSVKHEKIVHLCELHAGLHGDLDRHAYKEAAGPYDPKARRSVEKVFRAQKWFAVQKSERRVEYLPLERSGSHRPYYDRYFGDRHAAIQSIIDRLRPMTSEQCEIIATLYAVWNDFLLDGETPTDRQIVESVLNNWHPSKRSIAEDRWSAALPWMRSNDLVPKGVGERTRVPA